MLFFVSSQDGNCCLLEDDCRNVCSKQECPYIPMHYLKVHVFVSLTVSKFTNQQYNQHSEQADSALFREKKVRTCCCKLLINFLWNMRNKIRISLATRALFCRLRKFSYFCFAIFSFQPFQLINFNLGLRPGQRGNFDLIYWLTDTSSRYDLRRCYFTKM